MSDYIVWLRPSGSTLKLQNTEPLNQYALNAGFKRSDESIHSKDSNLEGMNKNQLIEYADKNFSVSLKKTNTKSKLIKQIRRHIGA